MVDYPSGFDQFTIRGQAIMAAPAPAPKPVEIVKPARKARKPIDPNESKADKFRRLAVHRVTRAVKFTRSLASLANKSQYEYTEEQIKKITDALNDACDHVVNTFKGKVSGDSGFKL